MKTFLFDNYNKSSINRIYNFIEKSDSAKFYNELFSDSFSKKELPELYEQVKEAASKNGAAYKIMEEIISFLETELEEDAIVIEIGGGIYQQRSANAYKRFKNYFPLDISYSSIERYTEKFNKEGFVADAKKLPFKTNSIDCIFTHTFLEHPLEPESVLNEIARVLKVGGIVVHNDAWFCRWWQRHGVVGMKKFSTMTFKEKCISIVAAISEIKLLRLPPIIARRFIRHLFHRPKENAKLSYKKLSPNYKLHLGCDEDAASAIDPIDVVNFYESKGFSLYNKLSFKERLFYPNKYIVLKKISSQIQNE